MWSRIIPKDSGFKMLKGGKKSIERFQVYEKKIESLTNE